LLSSISIMQKENRNPKSAVAPLIPDDLVRKKVKRNKEPALPKP
jgi:hypothetical protein